jgi:hypothetical protein
MTSDSASSEKPAPVNLRDPNFAALLAWLWPGAGHIYQRRYAKGALFMICILGVFFYGLMLGSGRVVYASWKPNDRRWHYVCQFGVGAPALPALIQSLKTRGDQKPFFPIAERYPENANRAFEIISKEELESYKGETLTDGFMAPPAGIPNPGDLDVLGMWHKELLHKFELGTLFTVIAGLLNILAIYDAYAGPAFESLEDERERKKRKKSGEADKDDEESQSNAEQD